MSGAEKKAVSQPQRLPGTDIRALPAENALRPIGPIPGIGGHIHVHGADFFAGPAVRTLFLVYPHPQEGEITHRLKKDGNRTEVLTKRPVILEQVSQNDPRDIIEKVPQEERRHQDALHILRGQPKQHDAERQREGEEKKAHPA